VALGALAISFAPVFVGAIDRTDLGPTGIAFYRTAIGAVLLTILALARREPMRPTLAGGLHAALAGALFAGDLWVWHRAILRTSPGLATILGNTQVFWVALAGAAFLGERLTARFLAAVPVALLGIALLTGVIFGGGRVLADPIGILLGLSTGVFYASYILTVRRAQSRPDRLGPVAHMAWVSLASAATSFALAAFDDHALLPHLPWTWVYLGGLALVAQVVGWVVLAGLLPRVPVSRASLLLLLQPTFATVWDAILFGNVLTFPQGLGAVLTLVAIYVGSTSRYPAPSEAPPTSADRA